MKFNIKTEYFKLPIYDVDDMLAGEKECVRYTLEAFGALFHVVTALEEFNIEIMGDKYVFKRFNEMMDDLIRLCHATYVEKIKADVID